MYSDVVRFRSVSQLFIADMLEAEIDSIARLAYDRVTTIGVEEYNDSSYDKSTEELLHELRCELADALFYTCLILGRGVDSRESEKGED